MSKGIEKRLCAKQSEGHRGRYSEGTVFTDNEAAKSALSLWKADYGIKGLKVISKMNGKVLPLKPKAQPFKKSSECAGK